MITESMLNLYQELPGKRILTVSIEPRPDVHGDLINNRLIHYNF